MQLNHTAHADEHRRTLTDAVDSAHLARRLAERAAAPQRARARPGRACPGAEPAPARRAGAPAASHRLRGCRGIRRRPPRRVRPRGRDRAARPRCSPRALDDPPMARSPTDCCSCSTSVSAAARARSFRSPLARGGRRQTRERRCADRRPHYGQGSSSAFTNATDWYTYCEAHADSVAGCSAETTVTSPG